MRSREEEALDPTTSNERLYELIKDIDLEPLVVKNPNCSEDLLLLLAFDHPIDVLENPVLEAFLLEDPGKWLPIVKRGKLAIRVKQMTGLVKKQLLLHRKKESWRRRVLKETEESITSHFSRNNLFYDIFVIGPLPGHHDWIGWEAVLVAQEDSVAAGEEPPIEVWFAHFDDSGIGADGFHVGTMKDKTIVWEEGW